MPYSEWNVHTLSVHVQTQFNDLRRQLDERHGAQTKAMETALTAADKAVQAALLSAKEAVLKAELASNARFQSVNEFRAQLSDQAATFVSRVEADARQAQFQAESDRNAERIRELSSRLDLIQGQQSGAGAEEARRRQATQLIIGAGGFLVAIVAVAVTLILALNG